MYSFDPGDLSTINWNWITNTKNVTLNRKKNSFLFLFVKTITSYRSSQKNRFCILPNAKKLSLLLRLAVCMLPLRNMRKVFYCTENVIISNLYESECHAHARLNSVDIHFKTERTIRIIAGKYTIFLCAWI